MLFVDNQIFSLQGTGIVLARKRAAHSLAPRRRGPSKVLIHSRRPIGRLTVFGSGPLREQALDGTESKNSRLLRNRLCINTLR